MTAVLPDTSVWVRHLRGDGAVTEKITILAARHSVFTCEPIAMELLEGARPRDMREVEALVDAFPQLGVDPHLDFRNAAGIVRAVRARGHTVRSSMDALIAAIALRHPEVTLVHDDVGFERIAEVAPLRHERWPRTAAS